jgi:hypothetical protein
MVLYDFCLLPAELCYIIVNVRNIESLMQFSGWCTPWKIANGVENLVLQALQFQQICRKFPVGGSITFVMDLMSYCGGIVYVSA